MMKSETSNKYEIDYSESLGDGSFGIVYKGYCGSKENIFAFKIFYKKEEEIMKKIIYVILTHIQIYFNTLILTHISS